MKKNHKIENPVTYTILYNKALLQLLFINPSEVVISGITGHDVNISLLLLLLHYDTIVLIAW